MSFNLNLYGVFAVIMLFILSFIINWVIKPNLRHKYLEIKLTNKQNAIKFASEYAKLNNKNINFIKNDGNFWRKDLGQNEVYEEKLSFFSNSLYAVSNTLFKTILSIKYSKNKMLLCQQKIKIIISILSIILSIFIIFNFWVGIIILGLIILLMALFEFFYFWKKIVNINKQIIWILKRNGIHETTLKKFLKYKKIFFIEKYISVYSEAIISSFLLFRKWGKDE